MVAEPTQEGRARATFPRRQRLTHARQYEAVYAAKMKKSAGPLLGSLAPNGLAFPRLGLSIGRGVGTAVTRTRLKRMIREAFRLHWREWPLREDGSFDVIIAARKHGPLQLEEYAELLARLVSQAEKEWARRARKSEPGP